MTISVIYEFTRDDGIAGFFKTNCANTDARNLLEDWRSGFPNRQYEILNDGSQQDDALRARVSTTQSDVDRNYGVMDDLCKKHGLLRKVVN